ncbi:MAG: cytochrome c, class [Deltaproteobacteria bacterium]|nr:cytochrome c, class [Deltaproteobacteria bacterium]
MVVVATAFVATGFANPPASSPKLVKLGRELYESRDVGCFSCHGLTGEGDGPIAFALKPPPRNLVKEPFKAGDSVEQVYATITKGLADTRMVGYAHLADADRWALAYYVVGFRRR